MTTLTSSGGRRNVNRSLLLGLAHTSRSKWFGEKFEICSLNMKKLSEMGCEGGHNVFAASRSRTEGEHEEQKVAKIFHLLCSYGGLSSVRRKDRAGPPNIKGVYGRANLCSRLGS